MKVLKKHRTKIKFIAYAVFLMMSGLIGRMTYVVVFRGEELTATAAAKPSGAGPAIRSGAASTMPIQ